MKRKMLWITAIAGLLVVGLGAGALAATGALTGVRFGCDAVPGQAISISGTVTEQDWNTLVVSAGATEYTVKTGPFKTGQSLPDLTGQAVTIDGYTGPGTNYRQETAEAATMVRARTISYSGGTIDLTVMPAGGQGPMGGRGAGQGGGRQGAGRGAQNGRAAGCQIIP